MRKIISLFLLPILFASCATIRIQENGLYETDLTANTVHKVSKDLDSYQLLFVPEFMADLGKDLSRFESIMTHRQVENLLEFDQNDTINPEDLSDALAAKGFPDQFLVLEVVFEDGLQDYSRWNLVEPQSNELLFSSKILINYKNYKSTFGALGNSLIQYLNENSRKEVVHSREELVFPHVNFGYMSFLSLINPSNSSTLDPGVGLKFFGEYRISRPMAFQLGFMTSATFFEHRDDIFYFHTPLHFKWYVTNSFDVHAGPQLRYVINPESHYSHRGELRNVKNFGWDLSMGLGYTISNTVVFNLNYTRGMSELAKEIPWGTYESTGESVKLDTFTLGMGLKF